MTLTGKSYNLYFTDIRMIGELLGGTIAAFMLGGWVGEAIAKKRLKKKGEKITEERTPEQILASHKKNFFVNYGDIVSATVKKKECIMKFTHRGMVPGTGIRKKATFTFDERDKTNVVSILTKIIPDKVVVK